MANGIFALAKTDMLDGDYPGWTAADHRAIIGDAADDDPNLATDDFLDDIAVGSRVATSAALASRTSGVTGPGQANADDITFPTVSGDQSEWITLYQHTGTESTSLLMLKLDTGVTGLPYTPNGGDATITWDTYIFGIAA
jgi:hypothetical protein